MRHGLLVISPGSFRNRGIHVRRQYRNGVARKSLETEKITRNLHPRLELKMELLWHEIAVKN